MYQRNGNSRRVQPIGQLTNMADYPHPSLSLEENPGLAPQIWAKLGNPDRIRGAVCGVAGVFAGAAGRCGAA